MNTQQTAWAKGKVSTALVLTCVLVLCLVAGTLADPVEKLFLEPNRTTQALPELPPGPPARRANLARLNPKAFSYLKAGVPGAPARLQLNLFPDLQPTAVMTDADAVNGDRTISRGQIEGRPGSRVILTRDHAAVAGSILIPGRGAYQIQYAGQGQHRIVEIDPEHSPRCVVSAHATPLLGAQPHRLAQARPLSSAVVTAAIAQAGEAPPDSFSIIDVLVVYTEQARNGAGGEEGIRAVIDCSIAEVNAALENSQVRARVRLVHRKEIGYKESGEIDEDLEHLTEDGEEEFKDVAELRDKFRADLVCMFTETSDGPYGGGNYMAQVSTDFADQAFSVVQRRFANTYYVLAHELGHNMGCQHDRANVSDIPAGSYNYGHRFVANGLTYRTVMAYQPGLPIPHYSNPDVSFLGVPTGVPGNQPNAANNAGFLNHSVAMVAAFRAPAMSTRSPAVSLASPARGEVFGLPGRVNLRASASDPDGKIVKVEYLAAGEVVAAATEAPYSAWWTNSVPGFHAVVARARDDAGATTLSQPLAVLFSPLSANPAGSRRRLDGTFRLHIVGEAGKGFTIDAAPGLTGWGALTTDTLTTESFEFVDAEATGANQRFYRVRPLP
ncbi:MAG: hypothetical protein HYY24_10280 [Verrucomicrobia bacterium]|nr:hypothetical protein [Verrucomicrobiota bacterium]